MSTTDRDVADGLHALAQMYERGVFAGRMFPEQGPTITITMPSVESVEQVAAWLDTEPGVWVSQGGDTHTSAVRFFGSVEVRAVHIQDAEVTA